MENPFISIVIPVYNAAPYIEETVNNFLAQTYQNIEIIVQDDRSKDETWAILTQKFGNNPKVKLAQNETNQGIGPNWNRAYDRATGDLVVIANADDIHFPTFLEKAVYNLNTYDVDFVTFKYSILHEATGETEFPHCNRNRKSEVYSSAFETIFFTNPFHIIYTVFKRPLIEEIKVDNKAFINTQVCDFELMFRYAYYWGQLYYDDEPMGHYRLHSTNNSSIPLAEITSFYRAVAPLWHRQLKKKIPFPKYQLFYLKHLKNYLKGFIKGKTPYNAFIIKSCLKYAFS